MTNWQDLFQSHILERGYDYYSKNRVINMVVDENSVAATVAGSQEYDVEVEFLSEEQPVLYCDCPYAQEVNYCKHMAAVLFEYDKTKEGNRNNSKPNIEQLVAKADETTIRSFLTQALKNDSKLAQRFTQKLSPEIALSDLRQYEGQINKIIHRHAGLENYIEFDRVDRFVQALMDFTTNDIYPFIEQRQHSAAFQLIKHLVLEVDSVDFDDFEGELYELSHECQFMWEKMLQNADPEARVSMSNWFVNQIKHPSTNFCRDEIEEIVQNYF